MTFIPPRSITRHSTNLHWAAALCGLLTAACGLLTAACGLLKAAPAGAAVAGKTGPQNLSVAAGGQSAAVVAVAADAGEWEKRAARDLVETIRQINGGAPKLADSPEEVAAALAGQAPVLLVGRVALETEPALRAALAKVAQPNPVLRADAIVLRRQGNRLYIAGTNDDSHYYAAAELLTRWAAVGTCPARWASAFRGTRRSRWASSITLTRRRSRSAATG